MHWSSVLLLGAVLFAAPLRADETVQFNRDIRPILAANCFQCHGFDANTREADLRLDVAESALAERDGKFAIKPSDLKQSTVWERITSEDPDLVMPPPSTEKQLTPQEKALLQSWIEQGAAYQNHWAFEPPERPAEPQLVSRWVQNPIDRFILKRLQDEKLQPQPAADRETLIRRVAFALTGLPPTIDQIDTFLNDDSPEAYQHMVDRFLSSRHFGEEQARHWLDVARYADTHGLHLDNERQMWIYRDWVVQAFNQNLPFDQFTTWQLAGDLLPDPTPEQLIATGFNRCNVTTSEGGSIAPEWTYRYAVDRTSTMVQTWMGLTGGCAVCHDHKYDPLSTREFYSLYAFFYSAADPAMDGNIENTRPFLKVPTAEQKREQAAANERVNEALHALNLALKEVEYRDPANPSQAEANQDGANQDGANQDGADQNGADQNGGDRETKAHLRSDVIIDDAMPFGTRVRNTSRNAVPWLLDPACGAPSGRRVIEISYTDQFDITIELALIPVIVPQDGSIEFKVRVDPYYPPTAISLQFDDGKKNRRAVWGDPAVLAGGFEHHIFGDIPSAGEWVTLSADFASIGLEPGVRLKNLVLQQKGGRLLMDDVRVRGLSVPSEDPLSSFQAWWKSSKGSNAAGISGKQLELLVAGPEAEHTPEQEAELLEFYLRHVQRPSESPVAKLREEWQAQTLARELLEDSIPGTFIFQELAEPREAFVMLRGQYDNPGEPVVPATPAVFPELQLADDNRRATRLDLAHWLLSDEHPLTARVTVNRFWQQMFGTGLVKTSDDFGTRGEVPSHPELLDWLAVNFRESGWDVKQLLRLMLNSATFRQKAVTSPELFERDPENRLLARGPRFRLDAEQLRDNALFVSGLINLKMGGRGVLPYQPPQIWEPVGYTNSNTRFYLRDHGQPVYRRSLYCFLKRTAPPPFMSNFDGPNREQFCTRRERSNTPLQALQLTNDVQHFEAARALAERTLSAASNFDDRLTFLYRTVLSRRPDAAEQQVMRRAYDTQHKLFSADPAAAGQAIRVGDSPPRNVASAVETAAWTLVANLILNLDETVTRN